MENKKRLVLMHFTKKKILWTMGESRKMALTRVNRQNIPRSHSSEEELWKFTVKQTPESQKKDNTFEKKMNVHEKKILSPFPHIYFFPEMLAHFS